MKMLMVGCSHRETSIALRERIAFSPEQAREALSRFQHRFPGSEAVLLSTCNRTEIYAASQDPEGIPSSQAVMSFLAEFHGLDTEQVARELVELNDEDVIAHLFTVAASLDSMVVGEAQILSQVKQAYELASGYNESMPLSHSVFQRAMHVAKRVAAETSIHERRISVPSVAISDLATQIFERFDDKVVLVIGAGEMAEETLTYLKAHGARDIRLVNRSPERAQKLAQQFSATVRSWDQLLTELTAADMVISTTGATQPIVELEQYRQIEKDRKQRVLFVLDLAVPRDFHPEIGDCLNVYLYTVDDLKAQCDENLRARQKELPKARKIIETEAKQFMNELQHRATVPTIRLLKEKASELKDQEVERLLKKLGPLDDRTEHEIRYAFDRLVNKLLHPPLESLREETKTSQDPSLVQALRRLFQLRD